MKTSAELLVDGMALIEAGWCKGASARDVQGRPTPFGGPSAVSFCMSGALCHQMNPVLEPHRKAIEALKLAIGTNGIAAWNDHHERTKEEVLAAYAHAVVIAQNELARIAAL